jgi:hypothetical protein
MKQMVAYVKTKQRLFAHKGMADRLSALDQLGTLDGMRTFWDFDDRITAPLHGFSGAQDYYTHSSSRYFLARIETPTLIIQAADDPFVFPHSLPEAHELSPSIEFELHTHGGHVGFVEGSLGKPGYYLERRIAQWLATQAAG